VTVEVPPGRADVDVPVRNPDNTADVPVRQREPVGAATGSPGGGSALPSTGGIDTPTGGAGGAGSPAPSDGAHLGGVTNPDGSPNYGGDGATVDQPPPGTADQSAPSTTQPPPGTDAPGTTQPGDQLPNGEPVVQRAETARPVDQGQPVIGDSEGGPGQWTEMNRRPNGLDDQAYATGIDRLDNGHPVEYVVPRESGRPVEFDGYYRHCHPPVEVYQEVKGNYNILYRPWMGPDAVTDQLDKWVEAARRQREAIDDAAELEWIFTRNPEFVDALQDMLDEAGLNVTVRYVPFTP
jgi:hypothetical protein